MKGLGPVTVMQISLLQVISYLVSFNSFICRGNSFMFGHTAEELFYLWSLRAAKYLLFLLCGHVQVNCAHIMVHSELVLLKSNPIQKCTHDLLNVRTKKS